MADHVRAQIRAAIKSALVGLFTTGSRVADSEVYSLDSDDLPGLNITTPSEQTTSTTSAVLILDRRLSIVVDGFAKAATPAELTALLDQIALEVESVLVCRALGDLCKELTFNGTTIETTRQMEKPAGHIALTYEAVYCTEEGAPNISV